MSRWSDKRHMQILNEIRRNAEDYQMYRRGGHGFFVSALRSVNIGWFLLFGIIGGFILSSLK